MRRQLAPLLVGRRVVAAGSHPAANFVAARGIVGAQFDGLGRRGKYLLGACDDGRELVIHLGMTGGFRLTPGVVHAGTEPADRYVRAWWDLDDGSRLEFTDVRRFGRLAVVPAGRYEGLPTLARMGPEPLESGFTPEGLRASLRSSDRHLKTVLLSQRPVAGVGNIYADEALWRAGLRPARRSLLGPASCARLHRSIVEVLSESLDRGGTTLRDYRTLDGSEGKNQFHLDCYGRGGRPCRRCGVALRHRMLDGRSTTWCPGCQR